MTKHFTLHDGTVMCYEDIGEGRPVVFVHGWAGNRKTFSMYMDPLVKAGYRFISMDQRGVLDTTASTTRPVTVEMRVADLHQFLLENGLEDVTLVGHSMGAMGMFEYVRSYGNDHIHSFLLMDAPPKNTTTEGYNCGIHDNSYTDEMGRAEVAQMREDLVGYFAAFETVANPDILKQSSGEEEARKFAENKVASIHGQEVVDLYESSLSFDGRSGMEKFAVPVAYFYPERGKLVPKEIVEYYRTNIPSDFTAVSFPSASHNFFAEPECIPLVLKTLLEFLEK